MPTPESLTADYMADLESEIASNAREIANGRADLIEYDAECRAELARLRNALATGATIRHRYGVPYIA